MKALRRAGSVDGAVGSDDLATTDLAKPPQKMTQR